MEQIPHTAMGQNTHSRLRPITQISKKDRDEIEKNFLISGYYIFFKKIFNFSKTWTEDLGVLVVGFVEKKPATKPEKAKNDAGR